MLRAGILNGHRGRFNNSTTTRRRPCRVALRSAKRGAARRTRIAEIMGHATRASTNWQLIPDGEGERKGEEGEVRTGSTSGFLPRGLPETARRGGGVVPDAKIDAARRAGAAGAEAARGREGSFPPIWGRRERDTGRTRHVTPLAGGGRVATKWRPLRLLFLFLPRLATQICAPRAEDEPPWSRSRRALMYGNIRNANYAVHRRTARATRRGRAGGERGLAESFCFTTASPLTREV